MAARSIKGLVIAAALTGAALASAGQAVADTGSTVTNKTTSGGIGGHIQQVTTEVSGGPSSAIILPGDYPGSAMPSETRGPNMFAVPQTKAGQ